MGGGPIQKPVPMSVPHAPPQVLPVLGSVEGQGIVPAPGASGAPNAFQNVPLSLPGASPSPSTLRLLKPSQSAQVPARSQGVNLRGELEDGLQALTLLENLAKNFEALSQVGDNDLNRVPLEALKGARNLLLNRAKAQAKWGIDGVRDWQDREVRILEHFEPSAFHKPATIREFAEIAVRVLEREKRLVPLIMKRMIKELAALPTSKDHFTGVKQAFANLEKLPQNDADDVVYWKACLRGIKSEFDRAVALTVVESRVKLFEVQGRSVGIRNFLVEGLMYASQADGPSLLTDGQIEGARLDRSGFDGAAGDYQALMNRLQSGQEEVKVVMADFLKLEALDRKGLMSIAKDAESFNRWTVGVGMLIGAMLAAEGVGLLLAPLAEEVAGGSLLLYGANGLSFHGANTIIGNTVNGTWENYRASWEKDFGGSANDFIGESAWATVFSLQAQFGKEGGVWLYRQAASRWAEKNASTALATYEKGVAQTPRGRVPHAETTGEMLAGFAGESYVGFHLVGVTQGIVQWGPTDWLKLALSSIDPASVGESFAMAALTKLGSPISGLMQKGAAARRFEKTLLTIEQTSADLQKQIGRDFENRQDPASRENLREAMGEYEKLLAMKQEVLKSMKEEFPDADVRDAALQNEKALRDLYTLPQFLSWMKGFAGADNAHGLKSDPEGQFVYSREKGLALQQELADLPWVKSAHQSKDGTITVTFDSAFFQGDVHLHPDLN